MTPAWPDWSGETCVIVASGPSANGVPLSRVKGRAKVIAINESWRLCPWADVLYACDGAWWRRNEGLPGFAGLKVTQEAAAARQFGLLLATVARGRHAILTGGESVGDGGNGGLQALNLAVNWGARHILLVGYDMTLANGLHWHGAHGHGLNNPRESTVRRWLAARWSTPEDVAIINCNPASALEAYPKMAFEDACDRYL